MRIIIIAAFFMVGLIGHAEDGKLSKEEGEQVMKFRKVSAKYTHRTFEITQILTKGKALAKCTHTNDRIHYRIICIIFTDLSNKVDGDIISFKSRKGNPVSYSTVLNAKNTVHSFHGLSDEDRKVWNANLAAINKYNRIQSQLRAGRVQERARFEAAKKLEEDKKNAILIAEYKVKQEQLRLEVVEQDRKNAILIAKYKVKQEQLRLERVEQERLAAIERAKIAKENFEKAKLSAAKQLELEAEIFVAWKAKAKIILHIKGEKRVSNDLFKKIKGTGHNHGHDTPKRMSKDQMDLFMGLTKYGQLTASTKRYQPEHAKKIETIQDIPRDLSIPTTDKMINTLMILYPLDYEKAVEKTK